MPESQQNNNFDATISRSQSVKRIKKNNKGETAIHLCVMNNDLIGLKDLLEKSNTNWEETEWEFPKGRRNHKESDLDFNIRNNLISPLSPSLTTMMASVRTDSTPPPLTLPPPPPPPPPPPSHLPPPPGPPG